MIHEAMWMADGEPGMEHVRLSVSDEEINADGIMLRRYEGRTVRIRYEVRLDDIWRTREVRVTPLLPDEPGLLLHADGQGHWTGESGEPFPELDGCSDVDIWASAFTNTIPIRRLHLQPGQAIELAVAFITLPEPRTIRARQQYTCIEIRPDVARYRYDAIPSGFTQEIAVDAMGLVISYPQVGQRIPLE